MSLKPRDQLWVVTFETYYDSFFQENLADKLISRWQFFDEVTKILVALTASASALSAWAVQSKLNLQTNWLIFAAMAAVLSIGHITLSVPRRLSDWGAIKQTFASLRIDLETFRYLMMIDSEFPVEGFTETFVDYRKRYKEGMSGITSDIIQTKRLAKKIQRELNQQLTDKIVSK